MEVVIGAIGICVAILFNCWNLWSMKKAQQQSVSVQLLKKRYTVYLSLKNWYTTLNTLIRENINNSHNMTRAFRGSVLKYKEEEKMISYDSHIKEYKKLLSNSTNQEEQKSINAKLDGIYLEKYNYITISVKKKRNQINMAAYLFSLDALDVDIINKFTNIYFDNTGKVVNFEILNDRSIDKQFDLLDAVGESLSGEAKNLLDSVAKILGTMEDQLTELVHSFDG